MNIFNKLFKFIFSKITISILILLIQILLLYIIFEFFFKYIVWIIGGTGLLSIIIVLYLINSKTNPSYKIAWIIPVLVFPVIGVALFLFCHFELSIKFVSKKLRNSRIKNKKIYNKIFLY